ncbi:FAD-binding oxidoreductase [Amorphus orientalis]|uniref:FAD/FMN-containing dehydrogenase n=1 Tax=Amorphus orientalis TaxID=649198 RepID=A0AAE3VLJ5_9HYPH|nr:FAD-binding oxidoreductase [Amorphus orientalis]MDQ0314133.1 FAD/FMN-containing dehydrogenase [Amorphus orientalis]
MSLIAELREALGDTGCLTGSAIGEAVRSDASGTGRHLPKALLRPASVAEVSAALAICHRHGQPVVPQGGMTGLAGGANPGTGDVVLSLDRFAGVEEIDARGGTMTVRAGTVLETAQRAAADAGLLLPIDLGARGSCRIGGVIATNAGGLRVIRYGTTRDNVLGLEMVLADGTVLSHLNRAVKDNTGYDLRGLFIGSEGTLGVVTRAVLRLRPRPAAMETALCALPDFDAVLALLERARAGGVVSAFEAMWADYFALNERLAGASLFAETPPFVVLMEMEGALEPVLEAAFADGVVTDALLAQSEREVQAFWDVREGHAMDAALPGLLNFDVSVAAGDMEPFARDCASAVRTLRPDAFVSFFGHVGDGNLHIAVHLPDAGETEVHEVDAIVYGHVRALGGSVSAEHGIGTLKRDWLGHSRSDAELAAMRAIKAALDPAGIMNPGKVI